VVLDPNNRRTFWVRGHRLQLRPWYDRPSLAELTAGFRVIERAAEIQAAVRAAADSPSGRAALCATAADGLLRDARGAAEDGLRSLLAEIRAGRWLLVAADPEPPLAGRPRGEPTPIDLADLAAPLAEEEPDEEGPLHILVRMYYDPDRPEAWDDKLRLFSTEDEGGTYDQTIDLTSEGDTQREERHLLVLFRDVVPDLAYSCFLDLGQTEGGFLLFYRHMLSRRHHVDGLPRDT
jgi:hypothetical protein